MYILGFNGPPNSGKDTCADSIVPFIEQHTNLPIKRESFSLPLRHIAYAMAGKTYSIDTYEDFKVTNFSQFDRIGRDLMIDVSEDFLKPTYGDDIMSRLLIQRNIGFHGILIVSDCGFQPEIDYMSNLLGAERVLLAQVHRPGCTFEGDSRNWVTHVAGGVDYTDRIDNDGGLDELNVKLQAYAVDVANAFAI